MILFRTKAPTGQERMRLRVCGLRGGLGGTGVRCGGAAWGGLCGQVEGGSAFVGICCTNTQAWE